MNNTKQKLANLDFEITGLAEDLVQQRKEILTLQIEYNKMEQTLLELKSKRAELDRKLAMVDGRYQDLSKPKSRKPKTSNIINQLQDLMKSNPKAFNKLMQQLNNYE